jgi:hypothetical protein
LIDKYREGEREIDQKSEIDKEKKSDKMGRNRDKVGEKDRKRKEKE